MKIFGFQNFVMLFAFLFSHSTNKLLLHLYPVFQTNFRIDKIEKTKNKQDVKFNTVDASSYHKPAILPMNKIDSQHKDKYIRKRHRFDIPVKPKQRNR
jgi:hypothetical protein